MEIEYDIERTGQTVTVHFNVSRGYPATREEPEELPEIEICSVVDANGNEVDLTSDEEADVEEKIWGLDLDEDPRY